MTPPSRSRPRRSANGSWAPTSSPSSTCARRASSASRCQGAPRRSSSSMPMTASAGAPQGGCISSATSASIFCPAGPGPGGTRATTCSTAPTCRARASPSCSRSRRAHPAISAEDLARLKASGEDFVLLDSRAPEEFGRFDVAGARSAPGVELIARAEDLIPSPDTLVVVTRAGRTRGIIGAQGLINSWVGVRRARLVLAATTACAPPSRRIG